MIERFTEKAIKVVLLAQEEAFISKNDKLYPEHILLGIVKEGSSLSAKLLKASGIDVDNLRKEVLKVKKLNQQPPNSIESMPFSTPVKKILREAWYDVQSTGNYYVTSENLFLSLLRDDSSDVIKILNNLDIDVNKIRNSVKKVANRSVKLPSHPEESSKGSGMNVSDKFDTDLLFEEAELKTTMEIAEQKLQQTQHESFGTEQLLGAILENENNWISSVLKEQGVSIEKFNEKLGEITNRKEEYNSEKPEFTPKANNALYAAHDFAKELGSTYIKPEHILLGILNEKNNLACKILRELDINTSALSKLIITPMEKEKPEVLTILKLAKEEARRMEQNIVGTEQILLGILGDGTGIAAGVLRNLGITLKDARIEIQKIIGMGNHYSDSKEMVFTPRAKRVLNLAWNKAKQFKRNKVGSEHLLLGITREKESIAMKVLENLGVDVLEIRQGILNEIKNRYSTLQDDII